MSEPVNINPRGIFEMSEEDFQKILEACKPTPCMMIGGFTSSTPQENANDAWRRLGEKMGFDWETVRPTDKGPRFFTAVPTETPAQRHAREESQAKEARLVRIKELNAEIAKAQMELEQLQNSTTEPV